MKSYLDPREYLRDTWRLARRIMDSGWQPEVLLALWRGGAAPGAAVHEFYAYHGIELRHMPVKCSSYTGIESNEGSVVFSCADEVFSKLAPGTKVLVVDDVFDTGKTAVAIKSKLEGLGVEMRLACVYWKPGKNTTSLSPDYFAKELDDSWIVFPHEMVGLAKEEIREKDELLADLVLR